MRKVVVVGCAGAGKSTFARTLGVRLGLPVTHVDRLFWKPGWQATETSQWRAIQRELVAGDAWLLDGNYGGTLDIRFAAADTVIFLDFPRWRCLARVLRRTIASRGRDTQAPGCPDKVDAEFLRWIWNFRTDSRPEVLSAMAEHGKHAEHVILGSPRDVRAYLARC
ncbi:MAG TPA: DNA topology modulation protein FlaR [Pseudonocardiaceae bacterium]|nr:DNA topology modulation protein FlaR [Pseudonocardiaceae bacterium]